MLWIETRTDDEARSLNDAMWNVVLETQEDGSIVGSTPGPAPEGNRFWADEIADLKDDTASRLAMARRHLPLPAAWREAALALRATIREARKSGAPYEAELRELHHFAAMSSFAGYGIIERVPYSRIAELDLSYERLGSERLPLLKKTDVKWMSEMWGKPDAHTSIDELYPGLQERERDRVLAEDEAQKKKRMDSLFADLNLSPAPVEFDAPAIERPQRAPGFFARLFGR